MEVQDFKQSLTETQVPCSQQGLTIQKQPLLLYTSCPKGIKSHIKDPLVFHWLLE